MRELKQKPCAAATYHTVQPQKACEPRAFPAGLKPCAAEIRSWPGGLRNAGRSQGDELRPSDSFGKVEHAE
jgi:hypothetical protein